MLKKKIILHIGLYKTGSTFVQNHLKTINNTNIKVFITEDQLSGSIIKYLKEPKKIFKEKILDTVKNITENKIIISNEGFFGHPSNGFKDVAMRFKLLEDLFQNPSYIIFFREPSSIIYSGFFQGLQKNNHLKLENYYNGDLSKLNNQVRSFKQCTNFKVFDYNKIFYPYLKIQQRILFVEYEKFFKNLEVKKLCNFIGFNLNFNFNEKANISLKNLVYLEFYNNFFLFKLIKVLWINLNKLFIDYKGARSVSLKVANLIYYLNKIIPKKYCEDIDKKHEKILNEIKTYHSKNCNNFKKKLKSNLHIFF